MKQIKIGMVGTGFAASFHTEAVRRVVGIDAEIVGVTSGRHTNAVAFAEKHKLSHVYESFEQMLDDPQVHVVDLCVPTSLHLPMALQAARAGKHLIVEKPLTGYTATAGHDDEEDIGMTVPRQKMLDHTLESMQEMEKVLQSTGVKFMYAENWVYAPTVAKARRLIAASPGTVMRLHAEESHNGSHASYASRWSLAGGGALVRTGSHAVGGVLHIKHYEGMLKYSEPIRPTTVTAEVGNLTKMERFQAREPKHLANSLIDCEDWGAVLIRFEDDSVAEVLASDVVLGGIYNYLEIFGSDGRIRCNINPNDQVMVYAPEEDSFGDEYLAEKISTRRGWNFASPDEHWASGYYQEMQDFMETIAHDRPPLSGWQLARDVVAVIYAAYVSAEEGRRVEMPQ
jgi:predicted dehydrogenase